MYGGRGTSSGCPVPAYSACFDALPCLERRIICFVSMHLMHLPEWPDSPGSIFSIDGEEAHHALRVRRLGVGDIVRACDGNGHLMIGEIAATRRGRGGSWELDLRVLETRVIPRPNPAVHIVSAAPKGDRLGEMIEGLSQVGAASWRPLFSERTVVEPSDTKLERLQRIALESMKQCGRTHRLDILPPVGLSEALMLPGAIIADSSGETWGRLPAQDNGQTLTILVGPEGGWTDAELAEALSSSVPAACFGIHTMRIETAAVVAAGIVMHLSARS